MQTVTFPGRFESLAQISDLIVQQAKEAGLDEAAVYAVDLAVDEAFTNIIEHAYGGEGKGSIQCTCLVKEDGLTITLRDFGRPFDPDKIPAPNVKARLKDLRSGGAGLFLIRKMMDEVRFEFDPKSGNVLTMVKRKQSRKNS
jgi:anti-sigma regulatory factor (Ser/Thr protein kinase)